LLSALAGFGLGWLWVGLAWLGLAWLGLACAGLAGLVLGWLWVGLAWLRLGLGLLLVWLALGWVGFVLALGWLWVGLACVGLAWVIPYFFYSITLNYIIFYSNLGVGRVVVRHCHAYSMLLYVNTFYYILLYRILF